MRLSANKTLKQIFLIIISLFITTALVGYIYLTKSAYWKIEKNNRAEIISAIKSAPPLPDKFYEAYNKIYPNVLDNGQIFYLLNKKNYDCPCRNAGFEFSAIYNIHLASLAFWLENEVTQKECLNYYVTKIDFTHNMLGVLNASRFYFNKEIQDMTEYEFMELIIMMRNPAYFNRKNNRERLTSIVNEIINRSELN